jgi:hypothetical protein
MKIMKKYAQNKPENSPSEREAVAREIIRMRIVSAIIFEGKINTNYEVILQNGFQRISVCYEYAIFWAS